FRAFILIPFLANVDKVRTGRCCHDTANCSIIGSTRTLHDPSPSSTAIERPNVKGRSRAAKVGLLYALLHGHYFQFSDNYDEWY
ncbi:hypothetical protein E4U16_006948, partial [Claviceps sp. LM84 group G4]